LSGKAAKSESGRAEYFKKELLASLLDASLAQGYTAPSLG
jgi:hypothetical protein